MELIEFNWCAYLPVDFQHYVFTICITYKHKMNY